ncbi:MAG: MerR family transcriptional regulator [Myxococcales bacterium]|nr:MerR family transcriptional regulator [Deltaproteobacteria bacterium]NNE19790.1 MerR family transcriptional regulator [Myxococcales bacterium]
MTDSQAPVVEQPKCDDLLTTGDMARLSESTLRTVRFYEQEGLIEPERRSACGHRLFSGRELLKLQLALDLREAGLSLQDIKDLFCLKSDCACPEEASQRMSHVLTEQIDTMQQKIAKLRKLREELTAMVSVLTECQSCDQSNFPIACENCDVLSSPQLPRALQVLWHES